ncbi:MAG: hypothetical protein ACD_61C00265G0011 [uncultured bacterium]|nr:MAG: hypothetical protein ACD_61C00265G0011 [uncultured bacterium]
MIYTHIGDILQDNSNFESEVIMKKTAVVLLNAIREAVSPLPDPKDPVEVESWRRLSKFLTRSQIVEIRTLILDEARISREFGLFIRPKDIDQEIRFWLVFVDYLAGPKVIAEKFTFDQFKEFATIMLDREFVGLGKYYFEKISTSKPKLINSNNAFRLHLEAVRARIIHAIFNNKLPPV